MLNFGYWRGATNPLTAQEQLCGLVGDIAELSSAKKLIDIGSGLGAPAKYWMSEQNSLDVICLNINRQQLADSVTAGDSLPQREPSRVNATSTLQPFHEKCADRVIALESAQHFRPFSDFIKECRRVLTPGGVLVLAIPVTSRPLGLSKLFRLGILSITWSSEHYSSEHVRSTLTANGFEIVHTQSIGREVYEPLTGYYVANRASIRQNILNRYPGFLESILYRSLLKMRAASQTGLIDYLIIKAS